MLSFYIKVRAEKFVGVNNGDGTWAYGGGIGSNGIKTLEEADKETNDLLDEWIEEYKPTEIIERYCHTEVSLKKWKEDYSNATELERYIVDQVYSDINNPTKIKHSFRKILSSSMYKLRDKNLLNACSRCAGLGEYSRNRNGETTCYKCKGFKFQLPRDSKKFRLSIKENFNLSK